MNYHQLKSKIVKTSIVLLIFLCWFSANAFSQQFLVIKFKDGREQAIPVADIEKMDFRQTGVNVNPQTLPKPGIYRVSKNGPSVMFTNITSTSISYTWWQTGEDYPPKMDRTTYFGRGTLTPIGGGVWRMSGKDQPGSSGEGNAVESELRFLSPTSVEQLRGRWWKIGTTQPPVDQWMTAGWVANLDVTKPPPKDNDTITPVNPALNIARGKRATQSSTGYGGTAEGGVDGVKNGSFGFHTENDNNPWWQVDLGAITSLGEIRIFNRRDCCLERSKTIQVLLSDDGVNWKKVFTNPGTVFGTDGLPLRVSLKGNAARFVRLQLNGVEYLHLDEVEVYGG